MARKTKEEAFKTRTTILDAAIELFAAQGVSSTTLAQIAKQASVTRGAVYWHFDNKEDLLLALKEKLFEPFQELDKQLADPEVEDPLGLLFRAQLEFFKSIKDKPMTLKLLRIFLTKYEQTANIEQVFLNQANCHLDGLNKIEKVLTKAIEKNQLSPDFNIRLGALATISFTDGLIHNWIMFPDAMSIEEDLPALLEGLRVMLTSGL